MDRNIGTTLAETVDIADILTVLKLVPVCVPENWSVLENMFPAAARPLRSALGTELGTALGTILPDIDVLGAIDGNTGLLLLANPSNAF